MHSDFIKRICLNPSCNKEYEVTKQEAKSDDGYCCFECWEETNCEAPYDDVVVFDEFEIFEAD